MAHAQSAPLARIRVLDVGVRPSTAWCGRLLGDYGADVVGCEPDDGHPLRRRAPFAADGTSIPAAYMLGNRRVATTPDSRALVAAADVIITSAAPGDAWHADALATQNPRALVCSITPRGMDSTLPGNDLTACAASGWSFVNGLAGREPLQSSGYQASYQAGTFAYGVIVSALLHRLANATDGQVLDISEREVLVSTAAPAPLRYQYSGFVWSRRAAVDVNEGPVPVADGWFALTISRPAFWIKAMRVLGLPDLADDPELQQPGLRHKFKDRFVERVETAMRGWRRMELFDALGAQRVIAGPVLRMNELAENPQLLARGFFRDGADGVRYPGPFARMASITTRTPDGLPAVTADVTFADAADVTVRPVRNGQPGTGGPLAGLRGLVLTQAWAGTYATQLLGLLGADVIQLETRGRLDSWRGTYQNPIPKALQALPQAQHAWNCSPLYNSVNLNKRCITVDLSEPGGVEVFKNLVQHVDFVAENFSPRVMGNLGIDYESLRQIKPDLVMASLSAYGAVGPWRDVPGIGGTIEPSSGMSALLGYDGEHPMNSGQMYPDPVAGLCGFAAIATALLHRDRTGEGQYIDLSMQEANFTFVGDAWLEFARNGTVRGPQGNRHPDIAPHGVFPARGADQWLALAAEDDAQWLALADVLGLPGTARYASADLRKTNEVELHAQIAERTQAFDKHELAARLTDRGVPAAAVLGPDELVADQALRDRGHMVQVHHPECGAQWQSGLAAHLSATPGGVTRHAPLQGQHSFEVFAELLGMTRTEYDGLVARGISGIGPSDKSSVASQA